ncbi:helix-turn-helix transcriptional regulator [Marinicella sp. W31]|uniref:helix-turn-helix transcriptional regulator n=1 Tax=Marinicella sp. W31 TaxID=3023713 RepID=UPI003756EC51
MDTFTILIIVLLSAGAIQGLVFGAILLKSNTRNKTANKILAVLLILLSYRLVVQTMRLFGLGYYDGWYYVMLDLSWIHGALLYFYVIAQTQPGFSFNKSHWIHFLPLMLQVIFSTFVRLQNLYWDGTKESLSWLGYWGYWLWMNQPTIYIVASALIIFYTHKAEKLLHHPSEGVIIDSERLGWLKTIITAFKLYFSMVLLILLGDLIFFKATTDEYYFYFIRFYYYPFFIGISILTYWIGIEGFKRKDLQEITVKTKLDPEKEQQLKMVAKALQKCMQEQELFKEPNLNLNKTAEFLRIKPYLVSQSLNEVLNTKFNDFINSYRIAEVQKLLLDPKKNKHNLLTLAMEAGFNSKSSFNRSVKKQLGISPNELRNAR